MKQLPTVITVAIGGALGAGCRWSLLSLFDWASHDILIFLFNIVGSALLGLVTSQRRHLSESGFYFASAGVVGGFTTFSTFAVDVAKLIDDGELAAAGATTFVTASIAMIFAGIGYRVGREIRR